MHLNSLISYTTMYLLSWTWVYAHTHCDRLDIALLRSQQRGKRWGGLIKVHTTLYLHEFDCRSYESLQTSSLISYATIVWLEPQFTLIWRSAGLRLFVFLTKKPCPWLITFDEAHNTSAMILKNVVLFHWLAMMLVKCKKLKHWMSNSPILT